MAHGGVAASLLAGGTKYTPVRGFCTLYATFSIFTARNSSTDAGFIFRGNSLEAGYCTFQYKA